MNILGGHRYELKEVTYCWILLVLSPPALIGSPTVYYFHSTTNFSQACSCLWQIPAHGGQTDYTVTWYPIVKCSISTRAQEHMGVAVQQFPAAESKSSIQNSTDLGYNPLIRDGHTKNPLALVGLLGHAAWMAGQRPAAVAFVALGSPQNRQPSESFDKWLELWWSQVQYMLPAHPSDTRYNILSFIMKGLTWLAQITARHSIFVRLISYTLSLSHLLGHPEYVSLLVDHVPLAHCQQYRGLTCCSAET